MRMGLLLSRLPLVCMLFIWRKVVNKTLCYCGAGTIGLLAIQCAVALGAKSVTAIDISSEKLALAKSFGAMQTFNSSEMSAPQMQSVLRELRFNQLILETAGVPQTVELAVGCGPS